MNVRDRILDPFGPKMRRKPRNPKKASNEVNRFFRWFRRRYFREHLPVSFNTLTELEIGDLRIMAALFRAFDGEDAREWTRDDLVRFIAGQQSDKRNLVPEEPMPFGRLPKLEKSGGLFGS